MEGARLIASAPTGDFRRSSAIRRGGTKRAEWKAKWATFGGIIWCRFRKVKDLEERNELLLITGDALPQRLLLAT